MRHLCGGEASVDDVASDTRFQSGLSFSVTKVTMIQIEDSPRVSVMSTAHSLSALEASCHPSHGS